MGFQLVGDWTIEINRLYANLAENGYGYLPSSPSIILPHPTNSSIILANGNWIQEKYLSLDDGETWQPYSPSFGGDASRQPLQPEIT